MEDAEESSVGDLISKQEKYKRELDKVPFKFETALLDLPKGQDANFDQFDKDDAELEK